MTDRVLIDYLVPGPLGSERIAQAWAKVPAIPALASARSARRGRPRSCARTTPCWSPTTTSTATSRTWRSRPAGASPTRSRWPASVVSTRRGTLVVAGVRFMGETAKILSPRQAGADARPRRDVLARPRLPARRVRRVLRREPRPDRRRLCQHERRGEGARRLDGDQFLRAGDRAAPRRCAARRSSGRRTGTWAATSSARPAPTCCMWNGACVVHEEFKGIELGAAARGAPRRAGPRPPGVARERRGAGRRRRARRPSCSQAVVEGDAPRVHRRHRQRHLPPDAPARPGQDADRGPDRGRQRHLQELRPLPVDGDERAVGRDRLPGARHGRDRRPRADPGPRARPHRADARLRRGEPGERSPRRATGSCPTSARPEAAGDGADRRSSRPTRRSSEARARNVRDALRRGRRHGRLDRAARPGRRAHGPRSIVREEAVLCGRDWFDACVPGRSTRRPGSTGATTRAPTWRRTRRSARSRRSARALLSAERPALNFLQLLSGTATATRRHVRAIEGASPNPRGCVDPRHAQDDPGPAAGAEVRRAGGRRRRTSASRSGTGSSSRRTTSPRPAASPRPWLPCARSTLGPGVPIQVEVETLDQLREALEAGAASVLLDNFTLDRHARGCRAHGRSRAARGLRRGHPRPAPRDRRDGRRPHLDRRADQGRAGGRLLDAARSPASDRLSH